jgi:hypothetical protein
MKYIVVVLEGKEKIFIFPKDVDHDRMYEAMEAIRFDTGFRDWSRKIRTEGEAVSAGFITDGRCHGRSETLGLDSRPEVDTALLRETFGKSDQWLHEAIQPVKAEGEDADRDFFNRWTAGSQPVPFSKPKEKA